MLITLLPGGVQINCSYMKEFLVLGSGAREHALVWKLSQVPGRNIYCAPGNAGISQIAECLPFTAEHPENIACFAAEQRIGLTVVGQETFLERGVVDEFTKLGLPIFGPAKRAASYVETSKVLNKWLCRKHSIPTAVNESFQPGEEKKLRDYLLRQKIPIVVKRDDIFAGKGATIVHSLEEAIELSTEHLRSNIPVVIEEFVEGDEVSITALCNGVDFIPFPASADKKQPYPGGPNTGGLGVYTPLPHVSADQETELHQLITRGTLEALVAEGVEYTGFLYPNIMLTKTGPKVLEENAREGDPETQAQQVLMKNDLAEVIGDILNRRFNRIKLEWEEGFAVSVALASEGYPGVCKLDQVIEGIEEASGLPNVLVFHAATRLKDSHFVSAGGRVLTVVGKGETLPLAIQRAYEGVSKINFNGMWYAKDIGQRGL